MLAVPEYGRPLKDILAGPKGVTASDHLEYTKTLRTLIWLQNFPDLAVVAMFGTFLPPHQRTMLWVGALGASWNVNVSSRGTSKSSAWCILFQLWKTMVFAKRKSVLLSATGFRGGQLILNDLHKLAEGGWDDQEPDLLFIKRTATNVNIVHRAQNFWSVPLNSFSAVTTFPTNDEDKLRGIRGNDLFLDEAATMSDTLIKTVAEPFLVVSGGMRSGGEKARPNSIYYTSTLDYSWRPFMKTVTAAKAGIQRDYDARRLAEQGKHQQYRELEDEGLADWSYVSFDYTDTVIKRVQTTRDGRRFEVQWPDKNRRFKLRRRGIPFSVRGPDGRLQRDGVPVEVITTYTLDTKIIEGGLYDGSTPESVWLAEQRNVVDSVVGNVYPHATIDDACNVGDRFKLPYKACSKNWKTKYIADERDYSPTVMYECKDPCVLGVDYAGGDRDFSAFVVMRIGPLARGEFDPATGHGKTDWSNVIWAEQHRLMSHADVANKIRELSTRYNLIYFDEPWVQDDWKVCRAIGLDMKGGGAGVRDDLVHINKQELGVGEYRIFDPLDKDPRVTAFAKDKGAKPMLDTIMPSDQTNHVLVDFTLAQLQSQKLYIAKWVRESLRESDRRLDVGFAGVKVLEDQLRKIQQEPTKNYRKFYMAGDTEKADNKKDLFSAWLYCAKQLRAHIIRQRMIDERPPVTAGAKTVVGSKSRGPYGRQAGGIQLFGAR